MSPIASTELEDDDLGVPPPRGASELPRRIGVITTSYPRWPGDHAGHFVESHARSLAALGHTVEVIAAAAPARTSRIDGTSYVDGASRIDDRMSAKSNRGVASSDESRPGHDISAESKRRGDSRGSTGGGVRVVRVASHGLFYTGGAPDSLERSPWKSALDAAAFTARLAWTVQKHAREWDAIVTHWLVPSAIAALPTTVPLLAIAHGGDVHTLRRLRLLAPTLHLLRARGATLVFVSAELREIAIAAAPRLERWLRSARVQPMGIDVARFAAITRVPAKTPQLLIASRLVPVKGIDVALEAFVDVVGSFHAELVIAGDGPERARLEQRSRELGIAQHVRFLGEVTTEERDRLLATATAVIVPSRVLPSGRTEGTPMIALEALAARVPLIASAVGGMRDLAGAQLVRPDDPFALSEEMARVIEQLGSDPSEESDDETRADPTTETKSDPISALDWSQVGKRLMPTW